MMTDTQAAWPCWDVALEKQGMSVFKAAVCQEARRRLVAEYGQHLRAVVLTGSLARNEAAAVTRDQRRELLGDADFLVIFRQGSTLPTGSDTQRLGNEMEAALEKRGIVCPITLRAAYSTYLERIRPHIFGYELRTCGEVIWGEPHILSLVPDFSPQDIPLEDGWRLLANRMIEQLEAAEKLGGPFHTLSPSAHYRTVKLYLDMATSFLLFVGAYEPTYAGRAERLAMLAQQMLPQECPFPLGKFCQTVAACTQWKLLPTAQDISGDWEFWKEAISYTRLLWRWELARLTGGSLAGSDQDLLGRWMQSQPLSDRLRGWLSVLRQRGWHRAWREWPRWTRLGWNASPRYRVYAAASELFFQIPSLLRPEGQPPAREADWERLRQGLPLTNDEREMGLFGWPRLASEIVWNYHELLEGTRA